jgi:hypothetical protein
MAQSFVPQGTSVICTMMTCGAPQEIGITRTAYTIHTKKGQPLLNINDKKLSAAFKCKQPAKFWGGLQALCLGIALAAAVVLTGGLAATVIIAACVVSIAAGSTSIYKMAHDCDVISSSVWLLPHETVYIENAKALLNQSQISCSKGGLINIIMDPVIAKEAAEKISNNNTKEALAQMGSMFAIGFISVYTAGATFATAAAFVSVAMYTPGEWIGENTPNPVAGNLASNAATDLASTAATKGGSGVIKDVAVGVGENVANSSIQNMTKGAAQYGVGVATESVEMSLEGAIRYTIGKNRFKFSMDKVGVGGLVANILIGTASDYYENHLAGETIDASDKFNIKDQSNGINVIAKTANI